MNKAILLVDDNPDDEALTLRALKKNHIQNEGAVARDGIDAPDSLFAAVLHAGRDMAEIPRSSSSI
ncbi:MAG TPA: hypothetical protein VFA47_00900 [Candidatus Manganitrophaceae bacterium]|nr:hypothetical protein [Candidatus Manganitrophaceae bacterium]